MKKLMIMFSALMISVAGVQLVAADKALAASPAYSFGDFKSSTLASKAWGALAENKLEAVVAYTQKCVDMYSAQAVKMQAGLKDFPTGEPQQIHSFWALNDVATCLYIQGEAYRKAKQLPKAKAAFERIVKEFSFAQCYDVSSKTFWKVIDGAKDKLDMMEKGLDLDYGNMSSEILVSRLWAAKDKKDLPAVIAYNEKLLKLYGDTAKKMQASMTEYAWESPEKIHSFWAVNDVGAGMYILGDAYNDAGKKPEALAAYKSVVNDYLYSQCWDPSGWFWKPAEAAQQKIIDLETEAEAAQK